MSAGYNVHVVGIAHFKGNPTRKEIYNMVPEYWCVEAGMNVGRCGHKHQTEEDARQCLGPMTDKYIAARWPKKESR